MGKVKHILLVIGFVFCFQFNGSSGTSLIPVNEIFKSTTNIRNIKVLSYIGDSIMTYIDIEKMDTLHLNCKWKKYNMTQYPNYKSKNIISLFEYWNGNFPKIGETVILIKYKFDINRILFARKIGSNYRFWNPKSIPFANTLFLLPETGIYKPIQFLDKHSLKINSLNSFNSEGFLISVTDFDKLRKKLNNKVK